MSTYAERMEKRRQAKSEEQRKANDEKAAAKKQKDPSSAGGMFHRFLEGMADPIYGASQFLENSVESVAPSVVDAVGDADAWLHDKTGGFLGKPAGVDVDEQLRRREQAYEDTYDVDGIDWMRGAGNVATGVALAPAAIGGSLPTTALALAAEGAAGGAFMPQVGEGDYWDQVGEDALLGAIGGGVGGTALHAGGRALTNHLNRPGMGVLKEAGVQPTVGQALGGMANTVEQKLASVPLIGDAVRHARRRAAGEFREAAFKEAGDAVGVAVEETGTAGVQILQDLSTQAYDDLTKFLPDLNISDDFAKSFDRVITEAGENGFDTPSLTAGKKFVDNFIKPKLNGGKLTGSDVKELDSLLKGKIKNAGSDNAKTVFTNIRERLIGEAADQSDEFATQLAKADELYAKKSIIQKASESAEEFTPAQLDRAVKTNDKAFGGGRNANNYTAGRGPLRELSRAGKDVLGDTVPDSGTAGRVLLGGAALTGGGAATGMIAPFLAAAAASGVGATRLGQKGTIGLLDILGKGGEKVGQEGLAMGSLLSYLGDD